MRRSNSSPSVALFPFLAVLVCAMGALILLLLVTTRKMRQVAVARALAEELASQESPPPDEVPAKTEPEPVPVQSVPVPDPGLAIREQSAPMMVAAGPSEEELAALEAERRARQVARDARKRINDEARARQTKRERDWQRMLVDLEASRENTKQRLKESRAHLADLKNRLQRTETNLQKLQERKSQLASRQEQDESKRAQIERQHQELADQIAVTQKEFAELRKAHAEAASQFAFIPYDGASGTTRRPIYLECTAAGIRFQPEGVLLDENDLKGFTESHNPLLFATQSIIDHWHSNPSQDDDPRRPRRPYVLLLVRPSGTVTYYVARKMLAQIGDDFGYELIEDDFPLQIPPSDGKTKAVIEQAVAQALRHRGESLAEGGRVGTPRLGQVMMGRSEEPIEFGTLNAQKAAQIAEKESPFTKNSTRLGKNFSITRSPVRSDEVLPDSFRTEIERHAKEANRPTGSNASSGKPAGTTEIAAGPNRTPVDSAGGISNGNQVTSSTNKSSGAAAMQGGGPGVVEIQRGLGRRNQLGNTSAAVPGQPGGPAGRVPQLPKLTDPFSREALADAGRSETALTDVDANLGFSGGNEQKSGPGTNAVGEPNIGAGKSFSPSKNAVTGSRNSSLAGEPGKSPADSAANTVFDPAEAINPEAGGTTAATTAGIPAQNQANSDKVPGARGSNSMAVDPAIAPSKSQFNGTDVNSGPNDPDFDPRTKRPGQVVGVRTANGTRSVNSGRDNGAGNVNNPFDRTEGAVVADKFAAEAARQTQGTTKSGDVNAGANPTRKAFGSNPQEDVKRQAKAMTPQQKQDIGRQRWGGSNVGQIGFEKKVKVQVLADRIIIGKNEVEIEVEPGTSRQELVDAILEGLDENSVTWGKPPKKFYWIPYLQFEVYKGGIVQYEQIHSPLKEWGLYSDVKFKDGRPSEPGLIRPASKDVTEEVSKVRVVETPKIRPAEKKINK